MKPPETCILICAEADNEIGTGHVRRMITLVTELSGRPGIDIVFQTSTLGAQIIAAAGLPNVRIVDKGCTPQAVSATLREQHFAGVVLDNYHWNEARETPLRANVDAICVIDDLANRPHDADLLIDQNANHSPDDYAALVPAGCTVMAGAAACMLQASFRTAEVRGFDPATLPESAPVFVSLGGGDPHRDLLRIVQTLITGTTLRLTVATGGYIADAAALQSLADTHARKVELIFDSTTVAQQMMRSRFAVAAGGTMTWERAAIGLPSLCLVIADNQVESAQWLADRQIHDTFDLRHGWSDLALLKAVNALEADRARRQMLSRNSKALITGEGVVSVTNALIHTVQQPSS